MRYIKDITSNRFKIGLYQWNNKYIVRIEFGMYEQTYKIEEYEVENVEEIEKCVDDLFLEKVTRVFESMHEGFGETLSRNEVIF